MLRALLLSLALCSHVQAAETLRVYNWAQYIDPQTLRGFERESGVKVEYQTFTTAAERDAALFDSSGWDVLVPSHFQLPRLIREGRIQILDKSRLANYANLDSKLLAALVSFENAQRYAVPYQWSSAGLVYDTETAVQQFGGPLPESWSLALVEQSLARLAPCGVSWLDAPEEMYSLLLNYQGKRLPSSSTQYLARQGQTLEHMAQNLRALNNEAYVDDLVAGRLCLAVAWSGQALMAARKRPSLQFVVPTEGAPISLETWVIPTTARNTELAYRFIDYMLRPQSSVQNSAYTLFYSALRSDLPQLRRLQQDQPSLILDPKLRSRLYFLEQPTSEQKEVIDKQWALLERQQREYSK
ncbi:Putrescine transport system substrate-binding protein [Pseudomonas sp. 8AS]|nr:Putrescine transport system substrate-binding protein [Pseudomonas sp. 8AS]